MDGWMDGWMVECCHGVRGTELEAWGQSVRLPAVGILGSKVTASAWWRVGLFSPGKNCIFRIGWAFNTDWAELGALGLSPHPFKATGLCGPADPCRMTMDEPSDWIAGGLDSDWRILGMSPLNTRQQHWWLMQNKLNIIYICRKSTVRIYCNCRKSFFINFSSLKKDSHLHNILYVYINSYICKIIKSISGNFNSSSRRVKWYNSKMFPFALLFVLTFRAAIMI